MFEQLWFMMNHIFFFEVKMMKLTCNWGNGSACRVEEGPRLRREREERDKDEREWVTSPEWNIKGYCSYWILSKIEFAGFLKQCLMKMTLEKQDQKLEKSMIVNYRTPLPPDQTRTASFMRVKRGDSSYAGPTHLFPSSLPTFPTHEEFIHSYPSGTF